MHGSSQQAQTTIKHGASVEYFDYYHFRYCRVWDRQLEQWEDRLVKVFLDGLDYRCTNVPYAGSNARAHASGVTKVSLLESLVKEYQRAGFELLGGWRRDG
ncbi:hypothetical protein HBI04_006370 [Parastagonospora nodorum]|nr:hypothetical protein HBI03_013580 [Parastagonospora nodorum]KAH4284064.1 hypothetical protein HBI04_006370 [Parastagonospora nodorum]